MKNIILIGWRTLTKPSGYYSLGALVIGGFIAFAIWLQLKEKSRLDGLRKIAALNNQLRQVRRYLDDMPPQYQPKGMRLWLFKRTVAIFDQLIFLQVQ